MNAISSNIKFYRNKQSLTQAQLADKVGVSEQAIYNWERGIRIPRMGYIAKMADIFHVSNADILKVRETVSSLEQMPSNITKISKTNIVKIPIIGEIACGNPILAEQNIDGYLEEPAARVPSGDVFFLKCKGNSMEPTISSGAYVLIKEQPEVEDGEIAAVLVDDQTEATLKRVHHQGGNIVLTGDNASFPPIVLNKQYPGRIIGKAIRVSFDL